MHPLKFASCASLEPVCEPQCADESERAIDGPGESIQDAANDEHEDGAHRDRRDAQGDDQVPQPTGVCRVAVGRAISPEGRQVK